jgi:hypothetical protein
MEPYKFLDTYLPMTSVIIGVGVYHHLYFRKSNFAEHGGKVLNRYMLGSAVFMATAVVCINIVAVYSNLEPHCILRMCSCSTPPLPAGRASVQLCYTLFVLNEIAS